MTSLTGILELTDQVTLLERLPDRQVMLGGAALMVAGLMLGPLVGDMAALMALWFAVGLGYSAALTPSGRLLRASSHTEDRPALFAAWFALSHACWLVTYPLAGWLGAAGSLDAAFLVLAALATASIAVASRLWRTSPIALPHAHPDLSPGHPHLAGAAGRHAHPVVIDDLHPRWPSPA